MFQGAERIYSFLLVSPFVVNGVCFDSALIIEIPVAPNEAEILFLAVRSIVFFQV